MSIRIAGIFVVMLGLTVVVAGCVKKEPIKIGFLGGMSGRNVDLGTAGFNGATLAVEAANRDGGINGNRIELIPKDDEQNPEIAVRQVHSLVQTGVKIIIGPMTSGVAAAVVPVANTAGVLLISPTVTSPDFIGKDDNFIRVCGNLNEYAAKVARYQYEKLGRRKVSIIYDAANSSYSERWQAAFSDVFEKSGGKVISRFTFKSETDKVFLNVARQILKTGPDLVLIVANSVDAASITQQLRKLKPDISLALSEWAATERFLELAGMYAEGVLVSQFLDHSLLTKSFSDFKSEYRSRFGHDPGFPAVTAHDAATLAVSALRQTGQNVRGVKNLIVSNGTFTGMQEKLVIDRFGDSNRQNHICIVKDGTYKVIQ